MLDELRREEVLSKIPQPQDRLLADSEIECINGAVVIAEENQVLWCATLDQHGDQASVVFLEEPAAGRTSGSRLRPLASLDLDHFLLVTLVANAVQTAGSSRFTTQIETGARIEGVVAPALQLVAGMVQFPSVIAGPGWFGMMSNNQLDIVATDPKLLFSSVLFDATWERHTEGPRR